MASFGMRTHIQNAERFEWVRSRRSRQTREKEKAPVREFAPPYKASDTEAAEQCFEPYSENRRFSEWVDPDGVAKKRQAPFCGVCLFSW